MVRHSHRARRHRAERWPPLSTSRLRAPIRFTTQSSRSPQRDNTITNFKQTLMRDPYADGVSPIAVSSGRRPKQNPWRAQHPIFVIPANINHLHELGTFRSFTQQPLHVTKFSAKLGCPFFHDELGCRARMRRSLGYRCQEVKSADIRRCAAVVSKVTCARGTRAPREGWVVGEAVGRKPCRRNWFLRGFSPLG